MKSRTLWCFLICIAVAAYTGCSRDETTSPAAPDAELANLDQEVDPIALELVQAAGWDLDPEVALPTTSGKCLMHLIDFHRDDLGDGLAHYSFEVRTGPDEFDRIGLHRVVRERRPGRPIRARTSIFLQHGDIKNFVGMFLPGLNSPRQPDDLGFAVDVARADVDVWGIDQAWALVPPEVTEFDFMADWDMMRAMDDLEIGIAVARVVRLFTGNGLRKMQLLGYSSGSATGFAYLEREAQRPRGRRQVNAFIAADFGPLTDDPGLQMAGCMDVEAVTADIAAGNDAFFNPFIFFGPPALADPDGPSDLIEGFTNLQAALAVGVYPGYEIEGLDYHFLAGTFDDAFVPTGLQYTNVDNWIDFMVYAPPYEANAFILDYSIATCSPEDSPYYQDLDEVTVPLLWIEPAGGAGPYGRATLDAVGSTDITELLISFYPPEDALLDFAHIDIFIADNAPELVWDPTVDWILEQGWR